MTEEPRFAVLTLHRPEDAEDIPDDWRSYIREAVTVLALARALWGIDRIDVEDREIACRLRIRPRPQDLEPGDAPRRQRRLRRALSRPH